LGRPKAAKADLQGVNSTGNFMAKRTIAIASIGFAALALATGLFFIPKAAAEDKPDGAALYLAKCGGCHSLAVNRIGPAHKGVFGRKAGAVREFRYSPALKASPIVWNDATLDRWLQDPQQLVNGSKMFLTVPEAGQRKSIIAYLKSPAAR
jgi:cytochrome c